MFQVLFPDRSIPTMKERKSGFKSNGRRVVTECQCMRIQYGQNSGWMRGVFGILLSCVSLAVLFWNEQIAVESSKHFHEGVSLVIPLGSEELLPDNEGQLVHVSGFLDISEALRDLNYGVAIPAVKLKRRVQMFQWIEEPKNNLDEDLEGESFLYKRGWKDKLIDSSGFISPEDHVNPTSFSIPTEVRVNPLVQIGKFILGEELKDKFNTFVQFTSAERPDSPDIKMHMGLYYHSADIWSPAVGDLRIQFSFSGPVNSFVSVIAKQEGDHLVPFYTESGVKIAYIHEGKKDHYEIFKMEHSQSVLQCFMFRVGSWISSMIGIYLATKTISLKSKDRRSKFFRNLMAQDPFKFTLIFSTYIALNIISLVWIFHKAVFGTLLLIFSACLLVYFIGRTPTPK